VRGKGGWDHAGERPGWGQGGEEKGHKQGLSAASQGRLHDA